MTAPVQHDSAGPSRLWMLIVLLVFGASLHIQLLYLFEWFQRGGSPWGHADWLVNLASGPVRRGPFGSGLLWLSEASGIAILPLLVGIQLCVVLLMYGLAVRLLFGQASNAAYLAVFSAAFFIFLIGAAPASSLRKEILGFVAILLLACPGGGWLRIALSAALLLACAWGHELGVLFLPAWLAGLWLLRPQILGNWAGRVMIGMVTLGTFTAGLYALRHPRLDDIEPICAAIRAAGPVAEDFCDGAIAWLAREDGGMEQVAEQLALVGISGTAMFLAVAGLSAMPLVHLLRLCRARLPVVLALVFAASPFFLLYPLGFDWGRWISIQVSVVAFIMLGMLSRGSLVAAAPPGNAALAAWLLLALATGINLSLTTVPFAFPLTFLFVLTTP